MPIDSDALLDIAKTLSAQANALQHQADRILETLIKDFLKTDPTIEHMEAFCARLPHGVYRTELGGITKQSRDK